MANTKVENKMFEELYNINVNNYTEEKNGLTYLSWCWAWAEIKKRYPNANYEILKFENNLPYVYDENTGYMVFTRVTIEDLTYEMWLPVMDGANKAMKSHEYTYIVKSYGKEVEKKVLAATMFDINKTIMRCLVKNLAMFGLGLYIYSGEDLPEEEKNKLEEEKQKLEEEKNKKITEEQKAKFMELGITEDSAIKYCKVKHIDEILFSEAERMITLKEKSLQPKEAK